MVDIEDDELKELLDQRKKKLLQEFSKRNNNEKNIDQSQHERVAIEKYLTEKAKRYLEKHFNGQDKSKVLDALQFLIVNGLVEPGIDVEALIYIARRVLGFDYKIYVEDEGEYREI